MLDIEIRHNVARYLSSQITLREFQRWFVPATWDVDQCGTHESRELAHTIDLLLAEFTNGHLPEDELRREMRPLVEDYTVTVSLGTAACSVGQRITTGSAAKAVGQSVGILSSAVLAS